MPRRSRAIKRDFRFAIPDSEREHAAKVLDAVLAILLVEMNDGFGVALGAIVMAARDQALAQNAVVVDLAVENDPKCAVFVAERLVAGRKIDDAEAAHAQTYPLVDEHPVIVRTPVGHDVAHAAHQGRVGPGVSTELKDSCNAAHDVSSPLQAGLRARD